MTRRRSALAILGVLTLLGVPPPSAAQTPPEVRKQRGRDLLRAVQKGDAAAALGLIEAAADVNYRETPDRPTPLMAAIAAFAHYRGSVDVVRCLLKAGANPNLRGKRGWTALVSAAHHGVDCAIAPLLKARADPNLRTETGVTALTLAVAGGSDRSVRLLLRAGANPDVRDPIYGTPLLQAAQAGRTDLTEALLTSGANPNLANREGTTPLIAAAGCRFLDPGQASVNYPVTVLLLLRSGAHPLQKDRQGRSAFDHARVEVPHDRPPSATESAREDILQLLNAGAGARPLR